jgi:AcrR family transcriptional regulator
MLSEMGNLADDRTAPADDRTEPGDDRTTPADDRTAPGDERTKPAEDRSTRRVPTRTPPTRTPPTRTRLLDSASRLFQRQGLAATGIKQILDDADATFSSLYHHFPEGKDQLAAEAIVSAGMGYQRLVEAVWDATPNPIDGVGALFIGVSAALEDSDYADACPIGTVALEVASTNEPLRIATERVFDSWLASASSRFQAAGIPEAQSDELALTVVTLLEGAFVLSRTAKSVEAMRNAGRLAVALVQAAMATVPDGREPAGLQRTGP